MKIHSLLLISLVMILSLSACFKKDDYDPEVQAQLDDAIIVKFLADNNIGAIKHSTGLYYQLIQERAGTFTYTNSTQVTVSYTGRLISGVVFDKSSSFSQPLANLIAGWQIGIPLIQKGGKIRLFIPSRYAYGPEGVNTIPGNAILDFDIELIDVK